jgi:hypothetical protein
VKEKQGVGERSRKKCRKKVKERKNGNKKMECRTRGKRVVVRIEE